MSFVEDPAHLSKSRLKEDLVAHNVELPPAASKKEVYVELHLKHIDQKTAADFSSDEEDQVQDVAEDDPEATEMSDPSNLTDDDLKAMLLKYGVKAGPIVGSTRALYERKLKKLLQSDGHERLNGAEKAVLYTDSEEEAEEEESGSEKQEPVEQSAQVESSQRACPSNRKPSSKWNSRNASKASEQSWSHRTQNPVLISRASSIHQHSGMGSGVPPGSQSVMSNGCPSFQAFSITQMMESRRSRSTSTDAESELNGSNVQEHWSRSSRLDVSVVDKDNMKNQSLYYTPEASLQKRKMKPPQEPLKDIFKDLFPDTTTTPTGIYATCRRPIKGAAQRPIQYAYPDTPISPMTLERREVERRLVPIQIQIFVFLIVACIVYFLFVHVENGSFVLSLLDSLSQGLDSEEGLLLQAETQDTQASV